MSTTTNQNEQSLKPGASIVYVTPDMAARWLDRNHSNRNLRERQVQKYGRDMAAGNWQFAGDPIRFDEQGNLIDGQHRLSAIVQTSATIPLLVVRGLSRVTQEVMDSGAQRSTADALTMRGARDGKTFASVIASWDAMTNGGYSHCMSSTSRSILSHSEALEIAASVEGLEESAEFASRTRAFIKLPSGAVGVAHRRLMDIDTESAIDFFDRIENLRTTGKGDPIHTLLKRIEFMRGFQRQRLLPSTGLYLLFRTWNAIRSGERLTKFQLGAEGSWAKIPEPR